MLRGLAADGVCLAHHLLQDEAEPLANRIRRLRLRGFAKRGEVGTESIELLGDIELVGENGDLLGDPLRIGAGGPYQIGNRTLYALVMLLQPDGRSVAC